MSNNTCNPALAAVNNVAYVDTIDVCNLKCPTCIRGLRGMKNSGTKMPIDKFRNIVRKLRDEGYKEVGLFNWTEPFINRDLHHYISIVKQYGVRCSVSSNFSLRRIPGLAAALTAGLDHLTVSISGFDQKVYEINHAGGNVSYVKENLRQAATVKAGGLSSTSIVMRFLKFWYNHDEEAKLIALAQELGLYFEAVDGIGDPHGVPFVAANKHYEDILGAFRSERPYDQPGKVCPLIFDCGTAIDAQGTAYLCSAYPNYEALSVGSYLDLPPEEVLLRKFNHPICASCDYPRRAATPADNLAVLEAQRYRLGIKSTAS